MNNRSLHCISLSILSKSCFILFVICTELFPSSLVRPCLATFKLFATITNDPPTHPVHVYRGYSDNLNYCFIVCLLFCVVCLFGRVGVWAYMCRVVLLKWIVRPIHDKTENICLCQLKVCPRDLPPTLDQVRCVNWLFKP